MHRFLVIQTAFTGDVVLATAVVERLHSFFPAAEIDFLLRKGNEGLLDRHPFLRKVWIWDKRRSKMRNLFRLIAQVRREKYTHVINLHRFASSGLLTWLSGAPYKAGFDKNPFSFCYTRKVTHRISIDQTPAVHETDRNQEVIAGLTGPDRAFPVLYPAEEDYQAVQSFREGNYICIAPASVWFTKQFPAEKWVDFINTLPGSVKIYLLGGPGDAALADHIIRNTRHPAVTSFCGRLSYLASAALMQGAVMNYVNDSAPLHFASSMRAPVTAVFCSTVPAFGFGPIHENGHVVEIATPLYCRPCGLHGHAACPEGHFRCAFHITNDQLYQWISNKI